MFCSNCGKTLKPDAVTCPHCGELVGESRFDGHPYTGAQKRIRPGEAVRLPGNHTKTTYMGSEPSMEDTGVDARTTYRATAGGSAPGYGSGEAEPLFNSIDEETPYESVPDENEPENDENTLFNDDGAERVDPEEADGEAENDAEPQAESEIPKPEYDEDDEIDEDAEYDDENDDEIEERERAARKAEKKAKKAQKRAEKAARRAAEDDDEDDMDDEEPDSRSRRRSEDDEDDEDGEEDLSELNARDIQLDRRAGISEDVNRYMMRLRETYEEKARAEEEKKKKKEKKTREKTAPVPLSARFGFGKRKEAEEFDIDPELAEEDVFDTSDLPEQDGDNGYETEETPEAQAEEYDPETEAQYYGGDEDEFVSENPHDDVYTDDSGEFENENFNDVEAEARRQKVFALLRYVIAAAILVAIAVGIVMVLSRVSHESQKAQIENVTLELYQEGVELMQYRVGDEYQEKMLRVYDVNNANSLIAFSENMTNDLDSLSALLPAEPALNDQRFINALVAIQEDINNCLTNDVLSLGDALKTNDQKQEESDKRWNTVRSKVNILAGATSTAQLDAIIKGERIEVIQQTTPEPAPTPTPPPFTTLSKGSKGSAVIELQTRLTELGYMDSEIDGDYGNKTKTAVQLFQKNAGLTTSGIADEATQEALFAGDAPKAK